MDALQAQKDAGRAQGQNFTKLMDSMQQQMQQQQQQMQQQMRVMQQQHRDAMDAMQSSPGTRLLVYRLRIWGGLSFIV